MVVEDSEGPHLEMGQQTFVSEAEIEREEAVLGASRSSFRNLTLLKTRHHPFYSYAFLSLGNLESGGRLEVTEGVHMHLVI